jgi:hypothetical protein
MLVTVRARATEHDDGHERKESTMQSIEITRFGTHRIGIALVAIGVLIIALAVAGVLVDVAGDSHGSARTETQAVQRPEPGERGRFLERNATPLDGGVQPAERETVDDVVANDVLELNVTPPSRAISTARSFADMHFLEMNTLLPGTTSPTARSYDEVRFLEMNQLPEGAEDRTIPDTAQPVGPK